ncbi:GNAT family N-acetyltransferase [Erythrobacter sp.]|uniref:GNAT family N-acetyltransferase n=1 Tax=Erythrobacter sp. TaxID=1042 RepID=UPI002E9D428F|nr:GNAT family N-acetyltransferase [Erythrobacter sp.]
MPDLTLRPLREHELADASALCLRSKAYWGYDTTFIEACRTELTLRRRDLVQSTVIAAEQDGRIVGIAQWRSDGRGMEIEKLFVDPDRIGSGIGRALLKRAYARATAAGTAHLIVTADPDAAAFYRLGFELQGEEASGSIPGRVLPVLTKTLRETDADR